VTELSPYSLAPREAGAGGGRGGGVGTLFDLETELAERMRLRPLDNEQQLQQQRLALAGGGAAALAGGGAPAGARPPRGGGQPPTATATWTDVGEAVELTVAVTAVPGTVVLRLLSDSAAGGSGSGGSGGGGGDRPPASSSPPVFFGIAGGRGAPLLVEVTPSSVAVSRCTLKGGDFANAHAVGEPLLQTELPFRVHVQLLRQLVAAVGRRLAPVMWDEAARALRLPLPKAEASTLAGGELALCGGGGGGSGSSAGGWVTIPSAVLVDAAAARALPPLLAAARVRDAAATMRTATAPLAWPRAPMHLLDALTDAHADAAGAGAKPLAALLLHRLRLLTHLLVGVGGATAAAGAAASGGGGGSGGGARGGGCTATAWRATCVSLAHLAAAADPPPVPKPDLARQRDGAPAPKPIACLAPALLQQRLAASRHALVLVRRDEPAGGGGGSGSSTSGSGGGGDGLSDAVLAAVGAGVVAVSTVVSVAGAGAAGDPCYAVLFRPSRVAGGGGACRPLLLDQPLPLTESLAASIARVMAAASALGRARPRQQQQQQQQQQQPPHQQKPQAVVSASSSSASPAVVARRAAARSDEERAAAVELGRALTQLQLTCEPPTAPSAPPVAARRD
jgi:hypothetical protein